MKRREAHYKTEVFNDADFSDGSTRELVKEWMDCELCFLEWLEDEGYLK